jgi:hypothetical protein
MLATWPKEMLLLRRIYILCTWQAVAERVILVYDMLHRVVLYPQVHKNGIKNKNKTFQLPTVGVSHE